MGHFLKKQIFIEKTADNNCSNHAVYANALKLQILNYKLNFTYKTHVLGKGEVFKLGLLITKLN